MNHRAELKFNEKVIQLIIFALMRLITKKAKDPDMKGRTNAAREKLRFVTFPEDYKAEERMPKALFKIKEPKPKPEAEASPTEEPPVEEVKKKSAKAKAAEQQDQEEIKILQINTYGSVNVLAYHEFGAKKIRDDLVDTIYALLGPEAETVDKEEVINRGDQRMQDEEKFIIDELKIPLFEIE